MSGAIAEQFTPFDSVERDVWFDTRAVLPPNWVPVYGYHEQKGYEARMYFDGTEWHELDKNSMSLGIGFTPDYWIRTPIFQGGE